jgi:hypothetical protein
VALQAKRSRVRFPMGSLRFLIELNLPSAYGRGVASAPTRNEYQRYFGGGGYNTVVARLSHGGPTTDRYSFDALRNHPVVPGRLVIKLESG